MADTTHPRRQALAGCEESNKLELRRARCWEHEGGDVAVMTYGIREFHNFPQCTNVKDANVRIGQRQEMRQRHAPLMPELHLRECVLDIVPQDMKKDTQRSKDVNTMVEMISFAQTEVTRLNDQRIAPVHEHHRKNVFSAKHEYVTGAVTPDTKSLIADLKASITAAMSANDGNRGRRPTRADSRPSSGTTSPRDQSPASRKLAKQFVGCWHCGKVTDPPNFQQQCRGFIALKKTWWQATAELQRGLLALEGRAKESEHGSSNPSRYA